MKVYSDADIHALTGWPVLIGAIEALFARGGSVPPRQVLNVPVPGGEDGSLLLMPAWIEGDTIGVKAVTFFPGNRTLGLSTISAAYLVFDGRTGAIRAAMDGDAITVRRTAATSAAAAKRLARPDAERLLVVGTGQLSPMMASAHAAVRRFRHIGIYGRDPAKAAEVVTKLADEGVEAEVVGDIEAAARAADVISCCTSATVPVILGRWLKAGCHIDLVGGFKADMREVDDETIRRAEIFIDARPGALLAGDLSQPLAAGVIAESDIRADFADLARGTHPGRTSPTAITLFKSVGNALEDLAAGRLVAGAAAPQTSP